MRLFKALLLCTPFVLVSRAQPPQNLIMVSSAPSGSCPNGSPVQRVVSTGALYSCSSGTWLLIVSNLGLLVPYTGATGDVNLGTNNLLAGNVGIGTTSPRASSAGGLTVGVAGGGYTIKSSLLPPINISLSTYDNSGTPSINKFSFYENPGAFVGGIGFSNNSLDFLNGPSGGYTFYTGTTNVDGTGASPIFKIQSNGNVGIGTTSPTYALDVARGVSSSGTARFYDQTVITGTTLVTITLGAAQTAASTVLSMGGVAKFGGTNTTAAVAGVIGATCPAVTCTAAYTWIAAVAADNSIVYFPVWK